MRKEDMMKKLISIPLAAMLLVSCASVSSDDFPTAWEKADAKRKEAASLGYEWRDTGKMLKKAKKEHEEGNVEAAMKLVKQAMEESTDAIAQAQRESELWASRVPQ
jgi:PBP1b-binding outer membrane lipoprotein LpoB